MKWWEVQVDQEPPVDPISAELLQIRNELAEIRESVQSLLERVPLRWKEREQ